MDIHPDKETAQKVCHADKNIRCSTNFLTWYVSLFKQEMWLLLLPFLNLFGIKMVITSSDSFVSDKANRIYVLNRLFLNWPADQNMEKCLKK